MVFRGRTLMPLPPWAIGPFDLLVHAEGHLSRGDDFDRRIALISYDNAIEVSITTYLMLDPIQRGGRGYPRDKREQWLRDYHSKLCFFDDELRKRKLTWQVDRSHVVWAHGQRNGQYHGGNNGTPEKHVLALVRKASLWIFGLLFDVSDVESALAQAILDTAGPPRPQRVSDFDAAIDSKFGTVDVADARYLTSEVLFNTDPEAYRDLGG